VLTMPGTGTWGDRLPERCFQFVPLWGMVVFFLYAPRRLECPRCGIHVEYLPWALGGIEVVAPCKAGLGRRNWLGNI
jgi:hypothetical protein